MPTASVNINQQRDATVLTSGANVYRVYTLITDAVVISDSLFLMQVDSTDTTDSSLDTFVRICGVGDLEEYEGTRAAALSANATYYRSTSLTKSYTLLETAQAASTVIVEKVNKLLTDYDTYADNFYASAYDVTAVPAEITTAMDLLIAAAEVYHITYTAALVELEEIQFKLDAYTSLHAIAQNLDQRVLMAAAMSDQTDVNVGTLRAYMSTAYGNAASVPPGGLGNPSQPVTAQTFWTSFVQAKSLLDGDLTVSSDASRVAGISLSMDYNSQLMDSIHDKMATYTTDKVAKEEEASTALTFRNSKAAEVHTDWDTSYSFSWE